MTNRLEELLRNNNTVRTVHYHAKKHSVSYEDMLGKMVLALADRLDLAENALADAVLNRPPPPLVALSMGAVYTLQEVKEAYTAGYYDGAGHEARGQDHTFADGLKVDAKVHRPLKQYVDWITKQREKAERLNAKTKDQDNDTTI